MRSRSRAGFIFVYVTQPARARTGPSQAARTIFARDFRGRTRLGYNRDMRSSSRHLWYALVFSLVAAALGARFLATPQTSGPAGVWVQTIGEDRHFLAELRLEPEGDHFLATPLEITEDAYPRQAYRSFDHQFSRDSWSFQEDWGDEVGRFELKRVGPDRYQGLLFYAGAPEGVPTTFERR